MTFIIGWKRNNTVFICSDSAITTRAAKGNLPNLPVNQSAFGELLRDEKENDNSHLQVRDAALKIVNIHEKLLVAYAGELHTCNKIIEDINSHMSLKNDPILKILTDILNDYNYPNSVSFIFAFCENGDSKLFAFNDYLGVAKESLMELPMACAGSIRYEHFEMAINAAWKFSEHPNDEISLVSSCAFLQSMTIHNYLLDDYVGGLFVGAALSQNGVKYLSHTAYILYTDRLKVEAPNLVSAAFKGNGCVIDSTFNGKSVYYNHLTNADSYEAWRVKEQEMLFNDLENLRFKFTVFISISQPKIFIFSASYLQKHEILKLKRLDSIRIQFGFLDSLMHNLLVPVQTDGHPGWNGVVKVYF